VVVVVVVVDVPKKLFCVAKGKWMRTGLMPHDSAESSLELFPSTPSARDSAKSAHLL
jgi:hypothetical protein